MEFQVASWEAKDDPEEKKFIIHMFGRTEDGRSVHVSTHFKPYFFVKGRIPGKQFVMRKDLWGFQNMKEHAFSMFEFDSLEEFREEQRKFRHGLYEANIDPLLRFMHRTGIKSTGWVMCPVSSSKEACESSMCDIDLRVEDWKTLVALPNRDDHVAPFRIMSLDIECYSGSGRFPDSLNPEDVCFQIAVTTKQNGKYIDRRVFGVKTEFNSEKEMLEAFVKHLRKIDPDVITGWNIFGFDLEYIYNRMVITGCRDFVLGRLDDENVQLTVKNLSSNALGNNTLKMVKMTGRYVFDMYQEIKREHKFESYSLNNVSKILLGDQKLDMPVKEIFSRFASGKGLEEVADYCVKDTELPHAISEKLSLFQNLVEMAKACWVPLNFLSERGQQIKVFSQLAYTARELGFMIPTIRNRQTNEEQYKGATVLEAQTGAYYEPITALDFASLYPSIMCAHNLCYSTLVTDQRYMDIPGVAYERFGPHVFALEKDGKRVPSLLPVILERLKVYRKEAKRKMDEVPELYNVYNGKQLAYKISMNSVYGFTGAVTKGILPCVAIAETVTMRGRQMIEQSRAYVETNFPGAKVRYGDTDSIMVQFDVEGKTGMDAIEHSWKLGERASKEISALFRSPNKLELEKVYCPYFLYSKKRYAAKMWVEKTSPDGLREVKFDKIDVKGLQVVRRDSCKFVRETCKLLLETVLETSDPSSAVSLARTAKDDLLSGRVNIENLVLTKSLASDYKVPMPHVEVVKKMRERNPGSEPQIGSRVPFVIVCAKGDRLFEKAEDPEWVIANNSTSKLDYWYYFEHQLKKPVEDLLEPLLDPSEIFATSKKNRKITEFFFSANSKK
jgi:DNA polymerase delta subunit 1